MISKTQDGLKRDLNKISTNQKSHLFSGFENFVLQSICEVWLVFFCNGFQQRPHAANKCNYCSLALFLIKPLSLGLGY